jgi:hypothetical protein
MPLQATSGAASYDAFGGGVATVPQFIENVFSCFTYNGTGATNNIVNGIDLSGKGGMVWTKCRNNTWSNGIWSTATGVGNSLKTNNTGAMLSRPTSLTSFNNDGFTAGADGSDATINYSATGETYVSWTFRKQQKFHDVLTYTGTGSARTITHNLGSVPGFIIVKRTDTTSNWRVYHRYADPLASMILNLTNAVDYPNSSIWNGTAPTNTVFSVGTSNDTNASGGTYVAFLFAHDAGGFGLTGTDNVVSCGAFTTDGTGKATVNLGWEPQWVLFKNFSSSDDWVILDNMRGFNRAQSNLLWPNLNSAEVDAGINVATPTATGFETLGGQYSPSQTIIYIAIRRGPMKVPTSGTSVFTPDVGRTDYVTPQFDSTFPVVDTFFNFLTDQGIVSARDRLRGSSARLITYTTAAETSSNNPLDYMYGAGDGASANDRAWMFGRAPNFHDVVCWTGDGTNPRSLSHNLTVAPTLIITKKRNSTSNWITGFDFASTTYKYFYINDTGSAPSETYASTPVYAGNPTASVFIVGNQGNINQSGDTYVSYLFATCAGVSKVGSYTGTATTKQIDCGFTGGARFVLIKRTDDAGDWYVWDTARGIVSGNDPYVLLNVIAAQVTNTDYIDTYSAGFEISSTAPAAINASGGTFIFLAIS